MSFPLFLVPHMSTTTHVPLPLFLPCSSSFPSYYSVIFSLTTISSSCFPYTHDPTPLSIPPGFLPSLLLPPYITLPPHSVISLLHPTSFSLPQVLRAWTERGNVKNLIALDLDLCDNLTEEALYKFLARYGSNLRGLVLSGIPQCTDSLCSNVMPALKNIR